MKIAVSYLKSNEGIEDTIKKIDASLADYIHVDIMDGKFVQEQNDDLVMHIHALKGCQKKLDIHLMMQGISLLKAIEAFSYLNPEYITIHSEIDDVEEVIEYIKKKGIKVGLAINPDTYILKLKPYFKDIQKIIVMGVYPGKGGQSFLESTVLKLKLLKEMIIENHYNIELEVDGGINNETIKKVKDFIDIAVSGSYICLGNDMNENIKKIKTA